MEADENVILHPVTFFLVVHTLCIFQKITTSNLKGNPASAAQADTLLGGFYI